ncbi:chemotaxis protein CheA [Hahella sp. KA22]|uniref:chemotaxis protein CheA n=1 Tax=Hahella sp. KA22 TaxID=1628392 RepID=UPI000FDF4BD4|nr:chemotaxis protein CheA [Hahella sp. KA22]AZZ92205.1 chemotaxis protein CheA [Hahella sp. KA22]QAY55576.1 chemotaxis protein CheA [Hahella sp. KA22]
MSLDFSGALKAFAQESKELLVEMEQSLLTLEEEGAKKELVDAVFRAAHTIKGSGGLFGLDHVVAFTHDVEGVLDAVRDGRLDIDGDLISLLLSCGDQIGRLVESSLAGEVEDELLRKGAALQAQLQRYLPGSASVAATLEAEADEDRQGARGWHISLRCGRDLLRDGMDPLSILHYISTLGELSRVTTFCGHMPAAEEMDPESCYLAFEMDLITEQAKEEIEDAFEFVSASSEVRITPVGDPDAWDKAIEEAPDEDQRLGEILLESGAVTRSELEQALKQQESVPERPRLGEILVARHAVQEKTVNTALEKQAGVIKKQRQDSFLKVDAQKLDHLINLIGELMIANAEVRVKAEHIRESLLDESVANSTRFIEAVRDCALSLRMVQIGDTFNRFQRVVRDLARDLGKDIRLVVSGGDTDLDKTLVERISEPLTHLVRNAIDHGIESDTLRRERGKPATGVIRLNAFHERGSIVIEVSDDGGGMNPEKIVAKAIEKQLIRSAEGMSDGEIFKLIFEPGFSTAEQVTNVSGRGVGMDAVKKTLEELRGSVEVESELGKGSTIRLRLPLTLAIINGFLVGVGDSKYVVPLEMVDECVELNGDGGGDFMGLRGLALPFLRLRDLFSIDGRPSDRQSVVVVQYAGRRAGLVVDRLMGELQTVIKPLGDIFTPLKWVSGCTLLGSGDVGLILDIPELVTRAENAQNHYVGRKMATG